MEGILLFSNCHHSVRNVSKYDIRCKLFLPTTAAIPTEKFWFSLRNKQERWGEGTRITIGVSSNVFQLLAMCRIEIVRCVECRRGRSRLSLMRFHRGCSIYLFSLKQLSVALVRERTIPTERPPPVGEVSANFCG